MMKFFFLTFLGMLNIAVFIYAKDATADILPPAAVSIQQQEHPELFWFQQDATTEIVRSCQPQALTDGGSCQVQDHGLQCMGEESPQLVMDEPLSPNFAGLSADDLDFSKASVK